MRDAELDAYLFPFLKVMLPDEEVERMTEQLLAEDLVKQRAKVGRWMKTT